jgi:surfeit locus 1 family protein
MPRRIIVFVALSVALTALFVRLGFWQLTRRAERREANAVTLAQFQRAATPFSPTMQDSVQEYRRVVVQGIPDWDNEVVLAGRSRNGSPGVHILTPVRLTRDTSTVVIVNRGWVYSADAKTVDLARWREDRTTFNGYTRFIGMQRPQGAPAGARVLRSLSGPAASQALSHPVAVNYVIDQDSVASIDSTPARLPAPALDEGPHMNYAIQWFAFAVIALVGAGIVARRSRVDSGYGVKTAARD